MAAGLGFKTFVTGDVLTAADTNGYLMQGVLVFASAAARDAAITSPQEGQFAYLKDTDVTTYYTGAAWTTLGSGMTNPMTTTGDTIYSSSGSTPARLGIGTTGQVLTVASGIPSWATPSAGGGTWTLLNSGGTTLSTTTTTISSISGKSELMILLVGATNGSTGPNSAVTMRFNGDTASNYQIAGGSQSGAVSYSAGITNTLNSLTTSLALTTSGGNEDSTQNGYVHLMGADSTGIKLLSGAFGASPGTGNDGQKNQYFGGWYSGSSAISSVSAICANAWDGGKIYVYAKG